jgi:hypothetical protein
VVASPTLSVQSAEAETRKRPPGLTAQPVTPRVWPCKVQSKAEDDRFGQGCQVVRRGRGSSRSRGNGWFPAQVAQQQPAHLRWRVGLAQQVADPHDGTVQVGEEGEGRVRSRRAAASRAGTLTYRALRVR